MKKNILFDLDGTLTDPQKGITNSVSYALKSFGIQIKDNRELNKFIGPPLKNSFMEYFDFSEAMAVEAVEKYREYFQDRGIFENKVYEGMPELLEELKEQGMRLYVATSKPTEFARRILEHFDMIHYFTDVQGSNMDGTRVNKEEVIFAVLSSHNITNLTETVMVGDRSYDVNGAEKCGIDSIGVLYGYGSEEELRDCHAGQIADSVLGLKKILICR